MKKLLTLIALATISAHAATNDLVYLQKNSSGKTVERVVTLTPSTFLSVNGSGQLQVQSSSAFLTAIGGATAAQGAKADTALQPGAAATTLNMATARILGRTTAASGAVEELTASQVKTLLAITSSDVSNFTTAAQSVGDARYPQLSGSYSNPAWVTALAWSKLTGTPTTLAGYGITDAQSLDPDLTALAALGSTGFSSRTASNTWAQRSIAGTTNYITSTNGDGVAGNPTINIGANVVTTDTTQTITAKKTLAMASTGDGLLTVTSTTDSSERSDAIMGQSLLGGATTSQRLRGILGFATANSGGSSTGALSSGSGLVGVVGESQIQQNTGTIAEMAGVVGNAVGYGVSTGSATYAYGLYSNVNQGSGVMTNGYGLYINDVAATNQWGIYQAGATDINYFAGSTTFNLNATVNGNFTAGDAAGDEFVVNDDDPRFPNLTAANFAAAGDNKVALNGDVGDARYVRSGLTALPTATSPGVYLFRDYNFGGGKSLTEGYCNSGSATATKLADYRGVYWTYVGHGSDGFMSGQLTMATQFVLGLSSTVLNRFTGPAGDATIYDGANALSYCLGIVMTDATGISPIVGGDTIKLSANSDGTGGSQFTFTAEGKGSVSSVEKIIYVRTWTGNAPSPTTADLYFSINGGTPTSNAFVKWTTDSTSFPTTVWRTSQGMMSTRSGGGSFFFTIYQQ